MTGDAAESSAGALLITRVGGQATLWAITATCAVAFVAAIILRRLSAKLAAEP